jgi:hypothetical protein
MWKIGAGNVPIGKLTSIFLIDGIPDGRLVGAISNWTGKTFRIPL